MDQKKLCGYMVPRREWPVGSVDHPSVHPVCRLDLRGTTVVVELFWSLSCVSSVIKIVPKIWILKKEKSGFPVFFNFHSVHIDTYYWHIDTFYLLVNYNI